MSEIKKTITRLVTHPANIMQDPVNQILAVTSADSSRMAEFPHLTVNTGIHGPRG